MSSKLTDANSDIMDRRNVMTGGLPDKSQEVSLPHRALRKTRSQRHF
jgi:hypothetical protein